MVAVLWVSASWCSCGLELANCYHSAEYSPLVLSHALADALAAAPDGLHVYHPRFAIDDLSAQNPHCLVASHGLCDFLRTKACVFHLSFAAFCSAFDPLRLSLLHQVRAHLPLPAQSRRCGALSRTLAAEVGSLLRPIVSFVAVHVADYLVWIRVAFWPCCSPEAHQTVGHPRQKEKKEKPGAEASCPVVRED